jgi:hypothetical protein
MTKAWCTSVLRRKCSRIPSPSHSSSIWNWGATACGPKVGEKIHIAGDYVVEVFPEIALRRQIKMCSTCFWSKGIEGWKCVCTLKKRYLNQWICSECDIKDRKAWHRKMKPSMKRENDEEKEVQARCECGRCLDGITVRIICDWCHKEIDEDPVEENEAEDEEEEDQEANDGFPVLHCRYRTPEQLDKNGEATLADGTVLCGAEENSDNDEWPILRSLGSNDPSVYVSASLAYSSDGLGEKWRRLGSPDLSNIDFAALITESVL